MITIAKISGTCIGASKAVDLAFSLADKNKRVYVFKEILHNPNVIKLLKEKQIECINDLETISKDSIVVIRAHGEPKKTYEYLEKNGIEYCDATCKNVARVHEVIDEKCKSGYSVIIIGKKTHPEVLGSLGWCDGEGIVVECLEDIDNIKSLKDNILIICQTTFNEEKVIEFSEIIKKKFSGKNIEFVNSICNAQKAIQLSASELAKNSDIMIVIGGEHSSNTKELLNVCKKDCESFLFSDINVFFGWLTKQKNINENTNIGITAGASTMKYELDDYKNLIEFYFSYKEIRKQCEVGLNEYNKHFLNGLDDDILKDAFSQFVRMNSDGKYIRAYLIGLAYQMFNKKKDDYFVPLSLAFETFQTSVLIHDDIIDNANVRRGKETIPVYYRRKYAVIDSNINNSLANSLAICLGDLGYFDSYKMIGDSYHADKNIGSLIRVFSEILKNTVKGQLIDVELPIRSKYNMHVSNIEKSTMDIYKLKTAWYSIIGPFQLGMTLAGKEYDNVLDMLEGVGIAFQIKDDLLGIYSSEEELGKTGTDIIEFKQTILYAYVHDKKPEYLEELLKYYGKSELSNDDVVAVQKIFEESGAREYAVNMMNKLFCDSKEKLKDIKEIDDNYKNILNGFITYLEIRNK